MMDVRGGGRVVGLAAGLCLVVGVSALFGQGQAADDGAVVASRATKVFHKPSCAVLKRTSTKNKLRIESAAEAASQGFQPCPVCKPGGDEMAGSPAPGKGKGKTAAKNGGDDSGLKFSRDIAPILVRNCADCHGGAQPKGQFSVATFNSMLKGGKSGAVIVQGNPDESKLVQLLESGEMPRGNNRKLSEEAVAKVAAWVKAGALLDVTDPAAELRSYAATPDDLRRAALAKLPADERDKKTEEVGRERWKKASSKTTPEVTAGKAFLLLSDLPKARAAALVKTLDAQLASVRGLLGPVAPPALAGPEKISVYVFNEPNAYVEFVRANESREVEPGTEGHGRLDVDSPYLAAADPLNGRDEPTTKKSSRSKKDDSDSPGAERSLAGILVEQLGASAVASAVSEAGRPPRWLSLGVGAFLGAQVEPRSPYYRKIRADAAEMAHLGWKAKVTDALGDQSDAAGARAAGFSLAEFLAGSNRAQFAGFVREVIHQGGPKLYDIVKSGFGADPDAFLLQWGSFVASRYGARR